MRFVCVALRAPAGGGGVGGRDRSLVHPARLRARQIAKGLAHVWGLHIVHRDLKPDNVLLGGGITGGGGGVATAGRHPDGDDPDLLCLVSDFGECLDCDVVASHEFVVPAAHPRGGAIAYHSPEVRCG
jgi:serine/threonine protein kinase